METIITLPNGLQFITENKTVTVIAPNNYTESVDASTYILVDHARI